MYRLIVKNVFVKASQSVVDLQVWTQKHSFDNYSITLNGTNVYEVNI